MCICVLIYSGIRCSLFYNVTFCITFMFFKNRLYFLKSCEFTKKLSITPTALLSFSLYLSNDAYSNNEGRIFYSNLSFPQTMSSKIHFYTPCPPFLLSERDVLITILCCTEFHLQLSFTPGQLKILESLLLCSCPPPNSFIPNLW